jgi:dihydropteroate synthase
MQKLLNKPQFIQVKGRLLSLEKPIVMGILNATPDSFYAESRTLVTEQIVEKAGKMLEEGAQILDVGGYSTRPNASFVSVEEETARVSSAIQAILTHFPEAIISVDTFRASVAEKAILYGAAIVNDVSGGQADEAMFSIVGKYGVPYILMHSGGNPQDLTQCLHYQDLVKDIQFFFKTKIDELKLSGAKDIILDLGFGFGKTIEQNYALLRQMDLFNIFELPLLTGISRKSMIYKKLNTTPENALVGTSVLHWHALEKGTNFLRVHDVKEAVQVITLYNELGSCAFL